MKAASVEKAKKYKPKKQPLGKRLVRYWPLYVMLLPCIIYYALICYVPMAGSVLAFKDYSFKKGIWEARGSDSSILKRSFPVTMRRD